jgi:hypothetical protein
VLRVLFEAHDRAFQPLENFSRRFSSSFLPYIFEPVSTPSNEPEIGQIALWSQSLFQNSLPFAKDFRFISRVACGRHRLSLQMLLSSSSCSRIAEAIIVNG